MVFINSVVTVKTKTAERFDSGLSSPAQTTGQEAPFLKEEEKEEKAKRSRKNKED